MEENPEAGLEAAAAEAAQVPRELSPLYRWVAPDVLGAPPILSQAYVDELKELWVIFGGGELERRYRVEAARRGERVCFMNLDHPTKPHWLWVNEVMFTEFGIRVPFSDFQQRLLNRACIAPSQLHPNAWASIRCFELVTEWLQLPQEPEIFLCLFTFYSANTKGKTKKGYMSVRPSKHRKIFGLFEDSFHDFKGRFFKILPVGDHRPFWLSLEGDGRFPSYWIDRAGFDVAPVTYKGLRAHQRDTVDVLTTLFAQNNLAPNVLLGRPEDARGDVVSMAGNNVTLNRLRGLVRPSPLAGAAVSTTPVIGHAGSGPSSTARGSAIPVGPTPHMIITPEEGSSNDGGRGDGRVVSPVREQQVSSPVPSKRSGPTETSAAKRQRTETSAREFSPLDRSFDASKFIAENLLGPKAQEALRDYDPVESFRWVQWALLKSATIMKSVEPRLTMMDEAERHNQRLVGDLKALNLQKMVLEEQLKDVTAAKGKAEEDLKGVEKNLEVLKKKKEEEIATFQGRIKELESEVLRLKDSVVAEKARADVAEGKIPELEKQRDDNPEDAKAVVAATEEFLKEQLAVLIPDFDVSRIGFFKEIVDGQVVDIPMDPPPS
ncbi:hypothetical protein PIB30_008675 [Stylosanthes scabra]|uniref:Transposase (putative) gypsy type domain-containing protein n=1 Tax=Stylosanthes scabra TaxID=79078 RepID=A0ABU6T6T3_9FABA|nr:hypothetical protein [Stylosanthes scabra]